MFALAIIVAIVVMSYSYWMISVDRCRDVVIEIAEQVARSKGVELVYTGTISENKMRNIGIMDRFLKPGFTFEIRNKRKANMPGKISVLNKVEREMYVRYLNDELRSDRRIRKFNFGVRIVGGSSTQRCQFVVCPRKNDYNEKERTSDNR